MLTVLHPGAPYSIPVYAGREYPGVAVTHKPPPDYCPRCEDPLAFDSEPIYHSGYGWFCHRCKLPKDR
jgi:hypothetical protein